MSLLRLDLAVLLSGAMGAAVWVIVSTKFFLGDLFRWNFSKCHHYYLPKREKEACFSGSTAASTGFVGKANSVDSIGNVTASRRTPACTYLGWRRVV